MVSKPEKLVVSAVPAPSVFRVTVLPVALVLRMSVPAPPSILPAAPEEMDTVSSPPPMSTVLIAAEMVALSLPEPRVTFSTL